jgi:hypothetical protein
MTDKSMVRKHWLTVRLNQEEYERLEQLFQQTTQRNISAYVRHTVLQKPVNVKTRNVSIDDFLTDMVLLKKEFSQASATFEKAVQKLSTLERIGDFEQWILANESDKIIFNQKIDAILTRINQLYKLWSQE